MSGSPRDSPPLGVRCENEPDAVAVTKRYHPTQRRLWTGTQGRWAIRWSPVRRLGRFQPTALAERQTGRQHNFGERPTS